MDFFKKKHKKRVSYFHRTATTTYPCCVPTLGDLVGADRERLTRGKSSNYFIIPIKLTNFVSLLWIYL